MLVRRAYAIVFFAVLSGLCVVARAAGTPDSLARPAEPAGQKYLFGAETNNFPFWVRQDAPAIAPQAVPAYSVFGPLIFQRPLDTRGRRDDGATFLGGFRPLWVEKRDAAGNLLKVHVLYPLFNWTRTKDNGYRWDIFTLINHEHAPANRPDADRSHENQFDVWPFYFSNQTGDPETSYRALFPIYGQVKNRLFNDRITWFLFPLYGRFESNNVATTNILWPIVRHVKGTGENSDVSGFAVWPLFGYKKKPGVYDNRYFLWPLIFKNSANTEYPSISAKLGVLPFYYRETAPGMIAKSYMIFFGYTRRTAPAGFTYSENRYFWPLVLRTRGEGISRDRFAPFYTHSNIKGREKTWIMWPLWKHGRWDNGVTAYDKKQFFFFLYQSIAQKQLPPELAPDATPETKAAYAAAVKARPTARKTSLWPLFTSWSDGRGRKQFQTLSPFEVFLPENEPWRMIYSPFFTLYRYEQEAPGHTRHSFLWNFVTYRREPNLREFHVGPLYSGERVGEHKRRAIFNGVLGFERKPGESWRPFAFKFKSIQQRLAEAAQPVGALLATPSVNPSATEFRPYPKVRQRR